MCEQCTKDIRKDAPANHMKGKSQINQVLKSPKTSDTLIFRFLNYLRTMREERSKPAAAHPRSFRQESR